MILTDAQKKVAASKRFKKFKKLKDRSNSKRQNCEENKTTQKSLSNVKSDSSFRINRKQI